MLATSRATARRAPALSEFEKRHEDRFKGATFDWMEFQRDGQPFPAPNPASRPAQQVVLQPRRRRATANARRSGHAARRASSGIRTGKCSRSSPTRLARRDEVRPPRHLDGHDRRQRRRGSPTTATSTAISISRRTAVPVVRAHVRHRHDHRAEAQPRRAARSVRAAGRRRRADQSHREMGSGAGRRALVAGRQVPLLHGGIGGETHLFRVLGAAAAQVEQVTKGERRISGLVVRSRLQAHRLHGRPRTTRRRDVFVANIDGIGRAAADRRARRVLQRDRARADRTRCSGRARTARTIEGWLTLPARLRSRARALSADRVQPRRPARGDRLQLRLQEAVLRGKRLLRARHQLPQLDRLRRSVQVGHLGRVGRQGRRGRHRRASTHVIKTLPDRSASASATPATRTAAS